MVLNRPPTERRSLEPIPPRRMANALSILQVVRSYAPAFASHPSGAQRRAISIRLGWSFGSAHALAGISSPRSDCWMRVSIISSAEHRYLPPLIRLCHNLEIAIAHRFPEKGVILLTLVSIGNRERCDGFIERIALPEVSADQRGIS